MTQDELYQKINEILIISQFQYWVEPDWSDLTAEQIKTTRERAFNYYLGRNTTPGKPSEEIVTNKFNAIVKMQTAQIMRAVEKLSPHGA